MVLTLPVSLQRRGHAMASEATFRRSDGDLRSARARGLPSGSSIAESDAVRIRLLRVFRLVRPLPLGCQSPRSISSYRRRQLIPDLRVMSPFWTVQGLLGDTTQWSRIANELDLCLKSISEQGHHPDTRMVQSRDFVGVPDCRSVWASSDPEPNSPDP
jgi:hypothetical protein